MDDFQVSVQTMSSFGFKVAIFVGTEILFG